MPGLACHCLLCCICTPGLGFRVFQVGSTEAVWCIYQHSFRGRAHRASHYSGAVLHPPALGRAAVHLSALGLLACSARGVHCRLTGRASPSAATLEKKAEARRDVAGRAPPSSGDASK